MSRKPVFFWLVCMAAAAYVFCYGVSLVHLLRFGSSAKDYGYWVSYGKREVIVTKVVPGHPVASLLQPGDRIVAVNGFTGVPAWLLNRSILLSPPNSKYTVSLIRGGSRMDVPLPVPLVHSKLWWGVPVHFTASLVCFAVALLMGLLKPGDRTVQLGCVTFLVVAATTLARPLAATYVLLDGLGRAVYAALVFLDPLHSVSGYLFASRFPRPVSASRQWRVAGVILCLSLLLPWMARAPWALFAGLSPVSAAALFLSFPTSMLYLHNIPHSIWKALFTMAFIAIVTALVRNYRLLSGADELRRIRWVVAGITVSVTPQLFLYGGGAAHAMTGYGFAIASHGFPMAEEITTAIAALGSSVTLAFAVLRHRILDLHLAVRRSIQYLLARRVLQATLALPIVIIAIRILLNPSLTVRDLAFGGYSYFALMLSAALGLVYRRTLLVAMDKRFFREAYNQEQILRTLIEEIKGLDSVSEISRSVSDKIESALHPQRVLIFHRLEHHTDFKLGHSSADATADLRIGSDYPGLRAIELANRPLDFPFSTEASAEDRNLESLGIRLVVPITGANRLLGILMLGEKRSEQPYTSSDREMLQSIAAQIGVVYENLALRETARRETAIKRNVLARIEGAGIDLLVECLVCGGCHDRREQHCPADGSELVLTLPVERTIDHVYRLERRIGSGGMGAVYRATDLRLGRPVAVKVMVGALFGNTSALRRFEREARAAARLSHPNIVSIFDFGAIGTDGAYLVMELIEGLTLRNELAATGALAQHLAASRFQQLTDGLAAAHEAGVIHRDLKPENLITSRLSGGVELVKILDFGLAKVTLDSASATSLTAVGAVMGTMGYMSPEQLMGEEVDERTDTFSLGVLVVEAITGRRPFAGHNFQELLHATLELDYHLHGADPQVLRLDGVISRCLAKRRESRPTVREIRNEIVEALRDCPDWASTFSEFSDATTLNLHSSDARFLS
jgi:hypothetical protein